ncbi:MAG: DNA repair protein RecN [Rickettsiales bacterium]|jgi:DNA repair protein RecN (Recombination protein N)|nr:DNA repair protein RecN [Rickettsiales bacterium]
MLKRIEIKNIVLIEDLSVEFHAGLNVMTGETGSGKSILMDALALSLGARSDVGLLRTGAESGQVISEFENVDSPMISTLMSENNIEFDGSLILRRAIAKDGKTRAWINGIPVNIGTLREVGDTLVEIHGQFENHSLMNPGTHLFALDRYAGLDGRREATAQLFQTWKTAACEADSCREAIAKAAAERDFLEYSADELRALNPIEGEEDELAAARARLMDSEKNASTLSDAAASLNPNGRGSDEIIFGAAHILERIKGDENPYQKQIDRLYEIGSELSEIMESVQPLRPDTATLESTEERLFALRAAARKHRVAVMELPAKLSEIEDALNAIENGEEKLAALEAATAAGQEKFNKAAAELSAMRRAGANALAGDIMAELPDLKLGAAEISIEIASAEPSERGADSAVFMIKTNPGTPAAPLHKIASGGELARLMLAMRVVLWRGEGAKTFVFDEVDTGISGATAAAVGERLAKLAAANQAIVITHSAQVAGFGDYHYLISKSASKNLTRTDVCEIKGSARENEIARILSGEKITAESVKNAKQLIKK